MSEFLAKLSRRDKKGLSTVVTTLIIILLVLVAVAIIWIVVRTLIIGGTSQAEIRANCIGLDLIPKVEGCQRLLTGEGVVGWKCEFSITRNPGTYSDEYSGIDFVFSNDTASGDRLNQDTGLEIFESTPKALFGGYADGAQVPEASLTGVWWPNKVEIYPYFRDESGKQVYCPDEISYEFEIPNY